MPTVQIYVSQNAQTIFAILYRKATNSQKPTIYRQECNVDRCVLVYKFMCVCVCVVR